MSDRTYRLAWIPVEITRNTMTKVPRNVLASEIPILQAMYGDGSVKELPLSSHNTAITADVNAEAEYDRLARIYRTPPEDNTTWVEKVYGPRRAGALEGVLRESAEETERRLAAGPGEFSGLADPQNARAAANATPRAVDTGDDGAQGELEGRTRPSTRDQLVTECEGLGLKVRVRDTIPHLQAMLTAAQRIQELGATPVIGGGLDEINDQLEALESAAAGGESGDVQAELESAANG